MTARERQATEKAAQADIDETVRARPKKVSRNPQKTHAMILEAATEEFAAHGFGGARVDAIAARAQTNKRMLYHYFGDKDALYLAVLENAYRKIRSAERELHLSELDPEEEIGRAHV